MNLPDFLESDANGWIRCKGHRIGLADILYFYNEGYSPEMTAGQFPTLGLSLIYKTIGFYLDNREEIDAYVENERREVERQRASSAPGPTRQELTERLLKMQQAETT